MCPACIATAALVVAGAISAGGVTALVGKTLAAQSGVKQTSAPPQSKESPQ